MSKPFMDLTKATADDVFWKFRTHKAPRELYTKINSSAVSITVSVTRQLESPLTCNVFEWSQVPQNVYGIFFTVGYPPETPRNITCMVHQVNYKSLSRSMQCSWDPGSRDPILNTSYSLCATQHEFVTLRHPSQNNTGELSFKVMPVFVVVVVWVEAQNQLGIAVSEKITLDPVEIVKTFPPKEPEVISEAMFPRSLLVKWKHPIDPYIIELEYHIRYCAAASAVPESDTDSSIESFRQQGLTPFTEYVFQVRCKNKNIDHGYWSDWSHNVTGKTPEDNPTDKPDLWREIQQSADSEETLVRLLWKEPRSANGNILRYEVKWKQLNAEENNVTVVNDTSVVIALRSHRDYSVGVTAFNSKGPSPTASLIIPKIKNEHSLGVQLHWSLREKKVWVGWTPPRRTVKEYVIERKSLIDGAVDWQREPNNSTGSFIKDLEKFKPYLISVYPVSGGRPGTHSSVEVYLEQGRPSVGPTVSARKMGKNDAELEWKTIPVEKRNGFITNYTIIYKADGGVEKAIPVGPDTHMYTLRSLSSNTVYTVHIMAFTEAGATNGTSYSFPTKKYAPGEIEAMVVPICIGFLFLTVLIVLFCINKKDMIKKHIWPQVPDPSNSTIADWSPDSPTVPDPPKDPKACQEGSWMDVSVVEIDSYDKKSMGEDDKASLLLKKGKYLSEEHSSGIGGSSCMSSPRQSVSDSDEGDSGQTTSSTVQYSTVVASAYKGQVPAPPVFTRSESTQPLLDSEERPEEPPHLYSNLRSRDGDRRPYFKRDQTADGTQPVGLNQIEIVGQNSGSLAFCPAEEGNLLDLLTEDAPPRARETPELTRGDRNVAKSYMPQQNGYRPQ
ncbi:IL6RB protein, partial [Amia calva]|nr:IL6RB protein [Amia calva]